MINSFITTAPWATVVVAKPTNFVLYLLFMSTVPPSELLSTLSHLLFLALFASCRVHYVLTETCKPLFYRVNSVSICALERPPFLQNGACNPAFFYILTAIFSNWERTPSPLTLVFDVFWLFCCYLDHFFQFPWIFPP